MNRLFHQQGMAVVELALVTTVLLFLLMVCSEFGRLFYQYNELTKSVRPAARYLSEHAISSAGAFEIAITDISTAQNLVVYGSPQNTGQPRFANLNTSDVVISSDSTHVTVNVAWTYQSLFGGTLPSFQFSTQDVDTNTLILRASLSMRALN